MFYFFAAFSGLLMAVQGSWNAVLSRYAGLLGAVFWVQATGLFVAGLLLLWRRSGPFGSGAPWYVYLGGAAGVGIVYLVAAAIPRLGVARATALIILGQVLTAGIIDGLGLFGLERIGFAWWKLGGVVLLALGARIILSGGS